MTETISDTRTPTVYEWAGGLDALERLTEVFYAKVMRDDLLEPMFRRMPADHAHDVAVMLGEVFGGPKTYTEEHGGWKRLTSRHMNRRITPEQRARWVELMLRSADEVGLPEDAPFRAAFVGYLEYGSRRAMANSQKGANPRERETIKTWSWGEAVPGSE